MYRSGASFAQRLADARLALQNALNNQDILNALDEFNFGQSKLNQGTERLECASTLHTRQSLEFAEQLAATDAFNAQWEAAKATYMRYLKLARIPFKSDRSIQEKLCLEGPRARAIAAWIDQAKRFYQNALSDAAILDQLKVYNLTSEKLEAGLAQVQLLETADATQKRESAEAREATSQRNAAFGALDEFMSEYVAVARLALEEHPDWLKELGFA